MEGLANLVMYISLMPTAQQIPVLVCIVIRVVDFIFHLSIRALCSNITWLYKATIYDVGDVDDVDDVDDVEGVDGVDGIDTQVSSMYPPKTVQAARVTLTPYWVSQPLSEKALLISVLDTAGV